MSSLDPFREPASVAVVGASDDQSKWGYWLARGALAGRHRRKVYLVNRSSPAVQGETSYPSVSVLPEPPELLVLCVPPAFVESVVEEALERGVRAFLAITAGVPHEGRLRSRIVEAGGRIIGPNSLGLYDSSVELQLAWGHFTPGSLAIVSQSGQLGSEIANLAARAGLGVSRFVSIGNQIDVNAAELLDDLVTHEATNLVALYLESFADGAHLVRTLRSLARAGKKTVVLTTGASEGSKRLARSHTGSLTSALDTVDAACRAAGAIRVSTPTELINVASYLSVAPSPHGRRLAVVSDSGGQGGIAADVAEAHGLQTPIFTAALQERLAMLLPDGASVSNPVDLAGAGEANLGTYADLSEQLLQSGEIDAVVFSGYLGCYGEDTPSIEAAELAVIDRLGDVARDAKTPLVVHSMGSDSVAVARMWEHGVPAFGGIEFAVGAIANAARLGEWPGRELVQQHAQSIEVSTGYWAAREALINLGIAVPSGVVLGADDDLANIVSALRPPYVLKAGWLEHKSEHGGVVLGLASITELQSAFDAMVSRLGDGEYVVEEQDLRPHVVEVLIGGRQDEDFGALISVGAGGTETELHRDACIELAPVDHQMALSMIGRLSCLPLLEGWRGRPAVDIDALAGLIVAVSAVVASNAQIREFEINPIRVGPDGALAVDALIVSAPTLNEGEHHVSS